VFSASDEVDRLTNGGKQDPEKQKLRLELPIIEIDICLTLYETVAEEVFFILNSRKCSDASMLLLKYETVSPLLITALLWSNSCALCPNNEVNARAKNAVVKILFILIYYCLC
jgi:hypothetical protein